MNPNSIAAYHELERTNKLSKYQIGTLRHIRTNPNCTQRDIAVRLTESHRKRISELLEMDLIKENGTEKVNGRKLTRYILTGNMQKARFKPMTLKQKHDLVVICLKKVYKFNSDMFIQCEIDKCLTRIGETL